MSAATEQPRVVVVDDNDLIRRELRELLEQEGFSVVGEATNGIDAVDVAMTAENAVILMDNRMPLMGGMEATRLIKERSPHTQVVLLTAYDDASLANEAEESGSYCYLVKGCAPSLIVDVLRRAWGHGRVLLWRAEGGA